MAEMKDRCIYPLIASYLAGDCGISNDDLKRHCEGCQQLMQHAFTFFQELPGNMTMSELMISLPCTAPPRKQKGEAHV